MVVGNNTIGGVALGDNCKVTRRLTQLAIFSTRHSCHADFDVRLKSQGSPPPPTPPQGGGGCEAVILLADQFGIP